MGEESWWALFTSRRLIRTARILGLYYINFIHVGFQILSVHSYITTVTQFDNSVNSYKLKFCFGRSFKSLRGCGTPEATCNPSHTPPILTREHLEDLAEQLLTPAGANIRNIGQERFAFWINKNKCVPGLGTLLSKGMQSNVQVNRRDGAGFISYATRKRAYT